jgi:hypothetical protein
VLFDRLVSAVGAERYAAACAWAWASAAGTGRCGGARSFPGSLQTVPEEFGTAWWDARVPLSERLEMGLALYREMPCYANTVALHGFYSEFSAEDRGRLWDAFRAALEDPDQRLADPVAYSLWVDFFEDAATVEEAWQQTTAGTAGERWERRVVRVLDVAGPAPWALKDDLFARLCDEPRLHPAIFRAIAGSAFDVFGKLGSSAASWLDRLDLPADTPDLAALRARVAVR